MPLFEYGLVDAVTVRSQRTQPAPGCPVPLSMLEEYEGFSNDYRKQVVSCTLDNELDLGMQQVPKPRTPGTPPHRGPGAWLAAGGL